MSSLIGFAPTVTIETPLIWRAPRDVLPEGRVNTAAEQIEENVLANIAAGWRNVLPHEQQDREIILLAGGPSLEESLEQIIQLQADGAKLITTNGAYGWALQRGLQPSAQIVLDARPFNARFTQPVLPDCRYLIASQAAPATLEGLPLDRTYLWHASISDDAARAAMALHGMFCPVPGGSTIVLRAIALLRILGFWRMHIFGFDSCVRGIENRHHAYAQPENDGEELMPVRCGNRIFACSPWMLHQAQEFLELVPFLGDAVELAVYGDGLIAHALQTGASFDTEL